MLTLRLLGELEVERDGVPVRLPPSKKTRALLGFLATIGRPQRRDRLIGMFWSIPDDPRGALRWSLSKLRETVDDDETRRIVAEGDTIAFNRDGTNVDVIDLRALATRGVEAVPTDELEGAAALFRGDFLEGLSLPDCPEFQAWHVAERSELGEMRAEILAQLCHRLDQEPARALPFARTWASTMPNAGSAQAALIRLLRRLGRPDEAEAQYHLAMQAADHMSDREIGEIEAVRHAGQQAGQQHAVVVTDAIADVTAPATAATETADPVGLLQRPAVAVLPFENMSSDPDQAYFADGITDDLITALYSWRWIPVIARPSTFAYKGRHVDVIAVGQELGARYVVVGSVRRAGNRVRVSAQLIDASSGHHLWAQRFDRDFDDVFAIQDEVTAQIVSQIEPELAAAERAHAARKAPQSMQAWDLNLRVFPLIRRGRLADIEEALRLIDESLKLAPDAGDTYAIRAYCHYQRTLLHAWSEDPVGYSSVVLENAQRAVALNDGHWLGHAMLGMAVLWNQRDYDRSAAEMQRAVELNPSAALAHQFLGCVHNFDGQPKRAISHLATAQRLNPHRNAGTMVLSDLSLAHLLTAELEESVYYARRAISDFSGDIRAWQRLTAALGQLGRINEAKAALDELEKRHRMTVAYMEATYPFRFERDRELFWTGLEKAGWRHN